MAANSRPSVERAGDRDKALETALVQIERQFGQGSVMRLGEEGTRPWRSSPPGRSRWTSRSASAASRAAGSSRYTARRAAGRPRVALHAVANAQKAGGIAAFIDAEHALDPDYAKKLGVDTDALLVSQPDTGEQALEIADMLIRSGAIDVIVIDSVAALVPRAEIEGEMGDSHVGLQARLMSQALRKITGALSHAKTTAIFINQLREKVGVMFGCCPTGHRSRSPTARRRRSARSSISGWTSRCSPMIRTAEVVPRKIVNWFNNGRAEQFLQFTVGKSGGNGPGRSSHATENHLVRTPGGWRAGWRAIAGRPRHRRRAAAAERPADAGRPRLADGRRKPLAKPPRTAGAPGSGWGTAQAGGLPGLEGVAAGEHPRTRGRRTPRVPSSPTSRPLPELGELHEMPSTSVTARSTSAGST